MRRCQGIGWNDFSMIQPFKQLRECNREFDRKASALFAKRIEAGAMLICSAVIMLMAVVDLAGLVWRDFRPLHGIGFTSAFFVGPAFFWVSLKDLLRFGLNWKYVASFVCSLAAIVFVGLEFHELLSVTPFFQ